jgi:cell division transport system permease protein
MVVALFMIGSTIMMSVYLNTILASAQSKVDINVYFSVDAEEAAILNLKQSLEYLPEVATIEYVSKEEAFEQFKERHATDELTIQALEELDDNPLRARLNIQAVSVDQYGVIAKSLENDSALSAQYGTGFIDKVNYNDNRLVIDRLNSIVDGVERTGFVVIVVLVFLAILITFNTIRLAIYTSKDEIGVMKLVGADNMYVRGPFVIAGTLYGVVAALLTIGLFYPVTLSVKQHTETFFGGIDLFRYYVENFNQIFLILMGVGIALGSLSSYLAVRKYLNK